MKINRSSDSTYSDELMRIGFVRHNFFLNNIFHPLYSLIVLQNACNTLPVDQYYTRGNRYRRLSKYSIHILNDKIEIKNCYAVNGYFQSAEFNPDLGGIDRKYQPLEDDHINDPTLLQILGYHASCLSCQADEMYFSANVHLLRMKSLKDLPCDTSPAGLHKDGEKYIVVYLLNRISVHGGMNIITDNSKKILEEFTLVNAGEGYTIDDDLVWHALTPVELDSNATHGYRDIILIDFIPVVSPQ